MVWQLLTCFKLLRFTTIRKYSNLIATFEQSKCHDPQSAVNENIVSLASNVDLDIYQKKSIYKKVNTMKYIPINFLLHDLQHAKANV